MFILNLNYVKSINEVEKYLPRHISFLEKYYDTGNFICSGRKNPRIGGIIICNAENIDEVESIIKEDPFYKQNIATYDITEFIPSKYSDKIRSVI